MKKILVITLSSWSLALLIGVLHPTSRHWLGQQIERIVLRHADQLPLAAIGKYLFNRHCAACHDNPDTGAPARNTLATLGRENLMITMEFGKMQPMAAGLSKSQRGLIAIYLAGNRKDRYHWLADARCAETIQKDGPVRAADWGSGPENRRFVDNRHSGLGRDNIGNLKLAWSFAFPGVTDTRSQPVVIGDTLYVGDKAGKLFALDRFSGCVRNHLNILAGIRSAITVGTLRAGRRLLFFADSLATVYAVDPISLDIVWQQRVAISDYSVVSGSLSFHNDNLFVPISSYEVAAAGSPAHPCCTSHGAVTALDAKNGKEIWTWHSTESARPQGHTRMGTERFGPSGASVWTTPAVDAKRHRIYIGSGENLSYPATDTSDAIIALDMDNGALVWKFQATPGDVWNSACLRDGPNCPENPGYDFDFGASVIIATRANGQDVLLAGQKSGEVFALDPDPEGPQGKLIWRTRLSQGTTNGGIHWGMALAGDTLFVPIADPERDIAGYTPRPGLSALDVATGKLLWHRPVSRDCEYDTRSKPLVGLENARSGNLQSLEKQYQCSFLYGLSAAITATPELVFSGALDGRIRVFDSHDGQLLWQAETAIPFKASNGIAGHGGAIDVAGQVVTDSWLYVLSGYSLFGELPGNMLLAYTHGGHQRKMGSEEKWGQSKVPE